MALKSDDKIAVIRTTGGDKAEYFTLADVNNFVSAEEDARLTAAEGKITTAETSIAKLPITIIVVNDTDATQDLTLTASKTYIVEALIKGETNYNLLLPSATGSGKTIRVSNKRSAALTITATAGQFIDADAVISLAQFEYATLVDYDTGKWARF